MIALTGIVFTVGLVMVQFSAIAYSPRLVLLLARDRGCFIRWGCLLLPFRLEQQGYVSIKKTPARTVTEA
jgi:hypothetical protein